MYEKMKVILDAAVCAVGPAAAAAAVLFVRVVEGRSGDTIAMGGGMGVGVGPAVVATQMVVPLSTVSETCRALLVQLLLLLQ